MSSDSKAGLEARTAMAIGPNKKPKGAHIQAERPFQADISMHTNPQPKARAMHTMNMIGSFITVSRAFLMPFTPTPSVGERRRHHPLCGHAPAQLYHRLYDRDVTIGPNCYDGL